MFGTICTGLTAHGWAPVKKIMVNKTYLGTGLTAQRCAPEIGNEPKIGIEFPVQD